MTLEASSIITGTIAIWYINFRHIIFKELSLAIRYAKGVGAIGIWNVMASHINVIIVIKIQWPDQVGRPTYFGSISMASRRTVGTPGRS